MQLAELTPADLADLIPIHDVPGHLPRNKGKKLATATLWRRILDRDESRRWPSVKVGGRRYTRMAWILEAIRRDSLPRGAVPSTRTPAKRLRELNSTERQLIAAGA